MDRRTYFADVVKASFEDFERVDVVVASYENFENFERNWVCYGLFFYVVLMSGDRTRFSKCSAVSGSPYFVDVESIQIRNNELSCGMFF